ncbi:sigma-70 family RNA polymerase sigma factor [Auraticoccus sp. F435]|uniref:Sigma-70 family RNA polymerase sigma factor n=1 Tax=Auraticoccus cholistanensis TaxID=2656650 RepID=A0A6A9V082_9ACTN|nr:ECF RNA polymerase sigma factor SigK [Auraticoccus cholistanensis]MVA74970.1 sigma-70 family RNA polymerase sigma factor [Auraticoccus cholistanensis]
MRRSRGETGASSPSSPGSAPGLDEQLQQLLAASARGDEAAFASLYDHTAARVHGIALRVLRNPDHAAEVTQEIFVEVWRTSARFDPSRGSVLAWICTMAHRRAVDRVRSVQSSHQREQTWSAQRGERDVDEVWSGVEQHVDEQLVREGLGSLTRIQREALTLAYYGGYTHTEVAGLLQLPLGTVKTRIRDGLIGLRDALGVGS